MREFLAELPPRLKPVVRNYRAMKTDRPDWPAASAFNRYGGFVQVREKARQVRG